MKHIDVLILYEHVARELETALILKKRLMEKGISSEIRKIRWNEGIVNYFIRPKIIVSPWCYDNEEYNYFYSAFVGGYSGKRLKVFNLHCEQISGVSGTKFLLPKDKAKEVYHFAWGEHFKEQLIQCGVDNKKIYITGSPRLDFFKPEYRNINHTKENLSKLYHLNTDKKWILLIGNFSAQNNTADSLKRAEKKGFASVRHMSELAQRSYDEILSWFEYVIPKHKEFEFIYRPHPNENITERIKEIQNLSSNFQVIKDLAISDWIVNSDIAYAWCSTSAVEVSAAGIPIFNLRPYNMPEDLKFPMLEDIEQITDKSGFDISLKAVSNGNLANVNQQFKKEIARYFSDFGRASVDIMSEILEDELKRSDGSVQTNYNIKMGIIKTFRYMLKRIAMLFGIRSKGMTDTLVNDLISKEKMQEYINRVQKI